MYLHANAKLGLAGRHARIGGGRLVRATGGELALERLPQLLAVDREGTAAPGWRRWNGDDANVV